MISIQEHARLIKNKLVSVYKEVISVKTGFGSIFPEETTPSLHVDVSVQRGNDLIAVDVARFTESTRTKTTKSTEKKYKPPFFSLAYNFFRDEVFMSTVALGNAPNKAGNKIIAKNALDNVMENKKMIKRAIRKQQADVLQTGIVTLKNGDSIDYKRKAASIVDLGVDGYWSDNSVDIMSQVEKAGRFLRDEGKCSVSTINMIMRGDALNALLANESESFKKSLDARRVNRSDINMPVFNEKTGMAFHGQFSAGDFKVNILTYNESYTDSSGNRIYYLNRENVIIIPDDFIGKTVYGALFDAAETTIAGKRSLVPILKETDYLIKTEYDKRTVSSEIIIESAPLVVPTTIDKVYTMVVLPRL